MREDRQSRQEPTVKPGQVWLIEQTATQALSPLDRDAVTGANVVIYDRALEPLVARVLPIGSYAEPLSRIAQVDGAISARALEFAAGGWSVVQLVEARPGWRRRLQCAVDALIPQDGGADDLPVSVIARTAVDRAKKSDRAQKQDACLCKVPQLIDEFGDDDRLTLVFGPLAVRYPAEASVFTANGLAG